MSFDPSRTTLDSLACGGFMIGHYDLDVFGEASRSPGGFMTVDFLTGTWRAGNPSSKLAQALAPYKDGLADLCARHGTSISAFRELTVRFSSDSSGPRMIAVVEDQHGRRATDEYLGRPGRRPQVVDDLGRIRRTKGRRSARA